LAATFSSIIRLQSGRDPRLYFRIDLAALTQATGIAIEESGFYRIGVRIEGVGSFVKNLRSVAARQDLPFYIPVQFRNAVEVGRSYEVVIDWIEKLPRPNEWRTGEEIDVNAWTWREISSWADTEGAIRTYLAIGQKDQKVIREICAFFDREGISCRVRLDSHTGVYYAVVSRIDDVAKIIAKIEPFIRTANKKMEIQGFKDFLAKPRKRLNTSVILARKILGIG